MENQNICGLTPIEIEELKEKHGFLILASITQGENTYHAIFKEPNFNVLESTRKMSQNNEIKATTALYKNCIVKADEAISTRDYLQLKAAESIGAHMQSFSTKVKNL
ncbi:hypothetical protein PL373_16170 [Tenacibaculum maritimum]|nr:hypothetical protein [Tenacibaculum maritimum]MDB0602638.1 hypothetical protein [Tenacibaculum maritimum]MDB0611250.1 hypothetical protein [Tenacibaculum maritimum]